ncbi:catalase isozyme 1, partial [Phtheirospermum japonicum]
MVHALKPNPKSHIQENWRILDFFSHHPESLAGKAHYVKFHWKPTCGVKCLLEEEAIKVGGANHSHATQD